MEKTHFELGEDEILLSSSTSKNSAGGSFGSIITFCVIGRHSTALRNYSQSTDCSFHRLFDPAPLELCILEQKAECVALANCQVCLAMLRLQLLCSFQPLCPFLRLSDVSNSSTQDSIMNAHKKTQFTYARINCALKDSSCDTLLPKILMLAILATCASLSSTRSI
ncbi:hypothetical protein H5410_056801 [Solanum commersonii]|uniref:Uncharacterized protein n=1 Tax=Solanum commersonii TaxID=4109 RepID=A0A9J5WL88_SOLCO|nr:hypothetical protein H5410_056801 [Solanum commersonii]